MVCWVSPPLLEMRRFPLIGMFFPLLALVSAVASLRSFADEEVSLQVNWDGDDFSFQMVGEDAFGEWLLQFSTDGSDWQDLLFLERGAEAGAVPGVQVSPAALPVPSAERGLFRVVEYPEADRFYREYLAARSRWRASGLTSYRYGFRWSTMIFWDGSIEVTEGEVSSYERLEAFPPFFEEPPMYRTIEGLFDRIADARARDAASIEVTWDPEFGYPRSAAIDQSLLIADEEQYWSIEFLEPIRQGEIR